MSKRVDQPTIDSSTHPTIAQSSTATDSPQKAEPLTPTSARKRRVSGPSSTSVIAPAMAAAGPASGVVEAAVASSPTGQPPAKKSRTNTPWTAAEEQRLKNMREAGNSWADIAKVGRSSGLGKVKSRRRKNDTEIDYWQTFPSRTEGSVKKHWYKDMHYAEFAEDESAALLNAIKEYETNKWKVIGQKVGKPAKACEQYAKEHFGNKS